MATQTDDLIDEPQDDLDPAEQEGAEEQTTANDDDQPHEDGEEVDVISWGDTAVAPEDETEGMRNLREALKREKQLRKDAEARVAPKADPVGDKPNMDDYWEKPEQFEVDLLAWNERKRQAGERETQAQAAARKQQERWEAQHRDLDAGYSELRAPGKDVARSTVEDQFPGEQFAYLVKAAGKNAPAFVLALGSASDKREELKSLAADGSWAEFIATAAVMAKEVNVQRRKPTTAPDQNHAARGASGLGSAGSAEKRLAALEAEADRTGDRSKVIAFKRAQKEQSK
jgi:hypothetical protein